MDPDWRFVAAYNAALQATTTALYASGFEAAKGGGAHYYSIESIKLTIEAPGELVDELQAFKAKRGNAVYEMTGIATESEIKELRNLAIELRDMVIQWLTDNHPHLIAKTKRKPQ